MSNEFDIEKAKRGEPVERIYGAGWQQVTLVAKWNDLEAICRVPGSEYPQLVPMECLRMGRKRVKVRFRVAAFNREVTKCEEYPFLLGIAGSHADEGLFERKTNFKEWLTEWQEAEVEQ